MPFIRDHAPAAVYLIHKGVKVYHAYDVDMVMMYWYTWNPDEDDIEDSEQNYIFDIREIPGLDRDHQQLANAWSKRRHAAVLAAYIDRLLEGDVDDWPWLGVDGQPQTKEEIDA